MIRVLLAVEVRVAWVGEAAQIDAAQVRDGGQKVLWRMRESPVNTDTHVTRTLHARYTPGAHPVHTRWTPVGARLQQGHARRHASGLRDLAHAGVSNENKLRPCQRRAGVAGEGVDTLSLDRQRRLVACLITVAPHLCHHDMECIRDGGAQN